MIQVCVDMQSQRELNTFALSATMKGKLLAAGFLTAEDMQHIKPSELSKGVLTLHSRTRMLHVKPR